ncbi:hypothetical protein K1719_010306 [Acacia pycnantha]|nr:hypothetical protein K1719_010306 [Acacia pycnantha]
MLVSTKHQKLKVIGNHGNIVTVKGDQKESRQCYYETVRIGEGGPSSQPQGQYCGKYLDHAEPEFPDLGVNTVELDLREDDLRPEPARDLRN